MELDWIFIRKQEESGCRQDSNSPNIAFVMWVREERGHTCLCPWPPKLSARLRNGRNGGRLALGLGLVSKLLAYILLASLTVERFV